MNYEEVAERNRIAWEFYAYEAWVAKYGKPDVAADKIAHDPEQKIRKLKPYLGVLPSRRILNPLGSHGRLAVSLALLGAEVTVIDISNSNRRYALEVAEAAGVCIKYQVGEFLRVASAYQADFDAVVMELGIVHYFTDLQLFVQKIGRVLVKGGIVVLNEFHPLLKKAIEVRNGSIDLTGSYFYDKTETANTPYEVFLNKSHVPSCVVRRWNLGEIVSAFAQGGFRIETLIEEPSQEVSQLPGSFILVASY